jgi:hypothetical protein
MSMTNDSTDHGTRTLDGLTALLNYVEPRAEDHKVRYVVHPVTLSNARPIAALLSLDREGFVLARQRTAAVDFYDDDEVRRFYYPQVDALVKEHTGARRVVVFNHQARRGGPRPATNADARLAPLQLVHNDETLEHGSDRLFECLPDEATELVHRRFMAINVWRPIRGPVEESPLAVCSGRSIATADCVIRQFTALNRVRHWYLFRYNPAQRWYYFPRAERDEVLLLKCYDSCEDGRTRFAAHTAFRDPTTPPDAAPRESIEVRALALF